MSKRKGNEQLDDDASKRACPETLETTSDNDSSSSGIVADCEPTTSKAGRLKFGKVTVYYFKREQGFGCIPSVGGHTLGMSPQHHTMRRYTLKEHTQELRWRQKQRYTDMEQYAQTNSTLITDINGDVYYMNDDEFDAAEEDDSADYETDSDYEESVKSKKKPAAKVQEFTRTTRLTRGQKSVEAAAHIEVEEITPEQISEIEGHDDVAEEDDECAYIQPLTVKERKSLLKESGVPLDINERKHCQEIRNSRATCGCSCKLNCMPDTCECALGGIKCQVDRPGFPCACVIDQCQNTIGRVEFNAERVRTHFLRTMMRLQQEGETVTTHQPICQEAEPFDCTTFFGDALTSPVDAIETTSFDDHAEPYQISSLYMHMRRSYMHKSE